MVIEEVVCDTVSGHDDDVIVLHFVIVWENLLPKILELVAHAALVWLVEETMLLLYRPEHLSHVGIIVLGAKEHVR